MDKKSVFVFGASGHAKVIIDIIEQEARFSIACLVDDDPQLKGQQVYGYPVIGGTVDLLSDDTNPALGIIAIGSNAVRKKIASTLVQHGKSFVSVVHPSAQLARGVTLGTGCAVMANAVINSDSCVGDHVIVNTKASIDHDCDIASFVHIAPGATLCGGVQVGAETFVGAGATVIPNCRVAETVVVGAGATVVSDVESRVVVVGTPATPKSIKG